MSPLCSNATSRGVLEHAGGIWPRSFAVYMPYMPYTWVLEHGGGIWPRSLDLKGCCPRVCLDMHVDVCVCLDMHVDVCVCVYALCPCIHTYVCVYIYIYLQVYLYLYMYVCVCVCMYVCVYVCVCVCVYSTYMHTCIHTYIYDMIESGPRRQPCTNHSSYLRA